MSRASHRTDKLSDAFFDALAEAVAEKVVARIGPTIEKQMQANVRAEPMSAPSTEQWLDVRTACERTSLGATKIHELLADGTLTSTKVGGRRLIAASSIDRLMRPQSEART